MDNKVKTPELLAGWQRWGGDEPFEDLAGPFFMKPAEAAGGKHLSAFVAGAQHMNGGDFLHGGMLMAFADYALFVIARDALDGQHAVTVSCQTDFLAAAAPHGEVVYADGEVSRTTRSLVFVRGRIYVSEDKVLTSFSGILKKIGVN